MRHSLAIAIAALLISAVSSSNAQADLLDDVMEVPRVIVNDGVDQIVPIIDLSETIPSGDDVRAFPSPRRGRLIQYPFQLLRYGLNLYPGSQKFAGPVNSA